MKKQFSDYVCPHCFLQLQDCTCGENYSPQSLIQIDEGIQDPVRMCNMKGWFTTGCCEGHPHDQSKGVGAYIQFDADYVPPYFPMGWTVSKHSGQRRGESVVNLSKVAKVHTKFPEKKLGMLLKKKDELLQELTEWADSLPINEDV